MQQRVHRFGEMFSWRGKTVIIRQDGNLEMATFYSTVLTVFDLQVPQTHSTSPSIPSSPPVDLVESQEMAKSARVPKQEADAREWRGCPAFLCGWHSFWGPGGCKETQWVEGTHTHTHKEPCSSPTVCPLDNGKNGAACCLRLCVI